ncbi:hypothetical protein FRB95_006137 [Tulasnella sp. JGI-2019a]|nr:hypothetical protein FRB93_006655 [Tulasnella sp. JGI-2019a]KAG9028732.1 hypothetical protein FRB95_006137 [Tulasnella sp. JGI-2019a]
MSKTSQLAFVVFSALAALTSVSSSPIACDVIEQSPYITAITTDTRIAGLQLTQTTGAATLTSSGFHGGWDWVNGGLGAFDACSDWWLNIGTSSTSVKPLTWNLNDQETTIWSGGPGEIVTTTAAPAQTEVPAATSTFLACEEGGSWVLYLQTGTDLPAGETCVATQLQEGTSSV